MRAIGRRPRSRARASDITSSAAAPSLMPELLPAVTDPDASRLNAGLSVASDSRVASGRGCSSVSTVPPGVLDGDDLIGEPSGVVSGLPALLRGEREGVLLLAADAAALDDVLGGLAHRVRVVRIGQARVREAPAEGRVVHRLLTARECGRRLGHDEGRAGHRLDAARDEDLAIAERDRVRGAHDRLEPRAAEPIHGLAGDLDRQAGEERRHAPDVAVVLAGLVRSPEDHVVDARRIEPGAVDERADDVRRHVVGPHVPERAAVATERSAEAVDDDRSSIGARAAHARDPTRSSAREHDALAACRVRRAAR